MKNAEKLGYKIVENFFDNWLKFINFNFIDGKIIKKYIFCLPKYL
jgi:hypothetical protein